ncbi:hypothetical protein MNB_SM-6-1115 [hydrothermal vent metagenome]|uniref:Uncharacterized protein n=1 Tax=hydrothermal vent metagenome TaxID=652676 RepID=A0A1W1BKC3_9ZZZZ
MNYNTSKTLQEQPHILGIIRNELEKQEKYQELKQIGISFEDFTIIRAGKYIQKAKSGFNLYCIFLYDDSIEFDFNEDNIELI